MGILNKETPSSAIKTVAVIPAAGSGLRMKTVRAKQFLDIDGKPLLATTLTPFERCGAVDSVIIVVPLEDVDFCRKELVEKFGFNKVEEGCCRWKKASGLGQAGA